MNSVAQSPIFLNTLVSSLVQTSLKSMTSNNHQNLGKKTILLVDDDTFLLDMYSHKLEKEGYQTLVSSSGEDALNILRSGVNVDLMLIDIIMPVMSGFELMKTMKEEGLDEKIIKVVLSNTSDQTQAIEKGQTFGVSKFMVKAESTPNDVVGLVNRMLN